MTDLPATTYQYDRWSSIVKDGRRWRRPDSELWGKVAYPRINPEPE